LNVFNDEKTLGLGLLDRKEIEFYPFRFKDKRNLINKLMEKTLKLKKSLPSSQISSESRFMAYVMSNVSMK
jgi:hypothetical protein